MILMVQGGAFALVAMGIAFVLLLGPNGVVLLSATVAAFVLQDDVVEMSLRSWCSR